MEYQMRGDEPVQIERNTLGFRQMRVGIVISLVALAGAFLTLYLPWYYYHGPQFGPFHAGMEFNGFGYSLPGGIKDWDSPPWQMIVAFIVLDLLVYTALRLRSASITIRFFACGGLILNCFFIGLLLLVNGLSLPGETHLAPFLCEAALALALMCDVVVFSLWLRLPS